jgi:hypothetical protein
MKNVCYILLVSVLMLATSCREASTLFGYQTVVRVGRNSLTEEEISRAMPKGLRGDDSLNYANTFIERWVVRQLKLQEAELMLSQSDLDIDQLVEDYRQSLLIRRIEQYYLEQDAGVAVAESEIEKYYTQHSSDFRLSSPVVKGFVVAFPEHYARRDWLVKMMSSPKQEMFNDFEQVCLKNNFRLIKFEEWVPFAEFLNNLPLVAASDHKDMLKVRKIAQISHNGMCYCYRIADMLNVGDRMPLFMARERIEPILRKRRQGEIISQNEERVVRQALSNGVVRMRDDVRGDLFAVEEADSLNQR